jgi:thiamine-monophosphate kinase
MNLINLETQVLTVLPKGSHEDRLLSDIGERRLIEEYIVPLLSRDSGNVLLDDCAILDLGTGPALLLTTDQGPRETFLELLGIGEASDVGHFHVTASISDIAAMGGVPIGVLLVMALAAHERESNVAAFLQGVSEALVTYDAQLLGGDTKQAWARATTVTAVGRVERDRVLLRRGARAGDHIFVTPEVIGSTLSDYVSAAKARHLGKVVRPRRPVAKIAFGQSLAASGVVTSCMDMSDGLISSASQLGQLNELEFLVDFRLMPLASSPKPDRMHEWLNLILNVGGDFGLLFTTSPEGSAAAEKLGAVRIGEVEASPSYGVALLNAPREIHASPWEQFKTTGSISDELLSFV